MGALSYIYGLLDCTFKHLNQYISMHFVNGTI